jgi:phage shock protein E
MPRSLLVICCAVAALFACSADTARAFNRDIPPNAVIVDVRTAEEFASGHFPGAINIPHDRIVEGLTASSVSPSTPLVLYCRSGNRSGTAEATLRSAGFSQLQNGGDLHTLLAVHRQTMVTPGTAAPQS